MKKAHARSETPGRGLRLVGLRVFGPGSEAVHQGAEFGTQTWLISPSVSPGLLSSHSYSPQWGPCVSFCFAHRIFLPIIQTSLTSWPSWNALRAGFFPWKAR